MENNKILIGVQFNDYDTNGDPYSFHIELYVLRDISLQNLFDGIQYGLKKRIEETDEYDGIYKDCLNAFNKCACVTEMDSDGRLYFSKVTFTSFNDSIAKKKIKLTPRPTFYVDKKAAPICDLGFINSSRIIFDATGGKKPPLGGMDTDHIIPAFAPEHSRETVFPEYNISTRQLYRFDKTPVDIIPPSEPPKKDNNGLFSLLLPSILSVGILTIVRVFLMSGGSGSGLTMMALSLAMGVTAVVTTTFNWKKKKKEYAKNLEDWRTRYQDYIDQVIEEIRKRQEEDAKKLDELYPDALLLMGKGEKGVFSLNSSIYGRSANEKDFLAIRLGISDKVDSTFPIHGEVKDAVFSEAGFAILKDSSGRDRVKLHLNAEGSDDSNKQPLCRLPNAIAKKYRYLPEAPLIYCLRQKAALGIVDTELANVGNLPDVEREFTQARLFVTRMVFELCYYHSPDDLQFVMFFDEEHSWDRIENAINRYKFMPHFRGLFSDRSQFVFDTNSAGQVLSGLLTIVNERKKAAEEKPTAALPHIICVVFSEHGLKEHAFAEYLPQAPAPDASANSGLGLTFVFVKPYKEYLPAYCDDVITFDGAAPKISPYRNVSDTKPFRCDVGFAMRTADDPEPVLKQIEANILAFRFLSSIYYARIAQNGKVPSRVGMFELLKCSEDTVEKTIAGNWGLNGKREQPSITESMRVPIGRTDENHFSYLDLHEKADGPHMLVAGTTGSGKTETIITYLLGLCAQYRPDELNLLLVDMKGGGFTKRLGHLPHVVGSVTDVDGDENGTGAEYMLGRFLNAMKAEVKRRKILFNTMMVDSIDAYISACDNVDSFIAQKNPSAEQAEKLRKTARYNSLAHLILVVDEFTELKRFSSENSEIDFIGEITTIARVGRSLGLHIILISQNIEGAITEDIRVNSRAKLCLKVATKQASKEMIGTELAASPQMPGNGRAYLLVGAGAKFEYFQSGYSGAGVQEEAAVEITLASKVGRYRSFYRSDKDNAEIIRKKEEQKKSGMSKTQLEAITASICSLADSEQYKEKFGERRPHIVFRPPLPARIVLDDSGDVVDLSKEERGE